MPSIADVRKDFPELAGRSDEEVLDAVHAAFYSDIPKEKLAKSFGVKASPAPAGKLERSVLKDTGVSLMRGGVGLVQGAVGIADLASGGRAGKALEDVGVDLKGADEYWADKYSPAQKAANKAVEDASVGEPGDDQGIMAKVGRVGMAALRNPSVIGHSVVQSLPSMAAGGMVGRGVLAVAPRMGALATGVGEGVVTMGQQAEQIRSDPSNVSRTLTPTQTALAAGSGALTGAIGGFSNRLAKSMGFETAENLMTGIRADATAQRGVVKRVLGGAVTEGFLEELPQSVQEQVAQNMALGKPLDDGVDQAAVLGALSGAAMGVGAQAFHAKPHQKAPLKTAGDVAREDLQPGGGPLATAVNAGVESVARQLDASAPPPDSEAPVSPRAANANIISAIRRLPPEQQDEALAMHTLGNRMDIAPGVRRHAQNQLDLLLGTTHAEEEAGAPLAPAGPEGSTKPAPAVAAPAEVAPPTPGDTRDAELAAEEARLREEEARAQRAATKPKKATGKPQAGDILATHGGPFTTMRAAMRAQAANPGSEMVNVEGGIVIRPKADDGLEKPAPAGGDRGAEAAPAGTDAGGDRARADGPAVRDEPGDVGSAVPSAGAAEHAPEPRLGQGDPALIDAAAHEAATSPKNDLPEPTEAQKEAGNYKKGHITLSGLDISVENPQGSERKGKRPDGSEWSHTMSHHYGYIKRTTGADDEQVDVYVGPKHDASHAYVVDQLRQEDGSFDEHKVMLGFGSKGAAIGAYRKNFDKDWKVGPVTAMPMDDFKAWLAHGNLKRPLAVQEKTGESRRLPPAPAPKPAETPAAKPTVGQLSPEATAALRAKDDAENAAADEHYADQEAERAKQNRPAAHEQEGDDFGARWTRSTTNERHGMLAAAGWLGGPNQDRIAGLPWDKIKPSQQARIAAGKQAEEAVAAAAAPAPKEGARERRARLVREEREGRGKPAAATAPLTLTPIGRNADGEVIREDANGVRHVSRNGVRVSETVSLRPTASGMRMSPTRPASAEFEPVAPLERAPQATENATPEARPAPAAGDGQAAGAAPVEDISADTGPNAEWWADLTPEGKRRVMNAAGIRSLPTLVLWRNIGNENRRKLVAAKGAEFVGDTSAAVSTGQQSQPAVSANTIVTDEAAEKARAVLRSKLGINTGKRGQAGGLDPDVLHAGITLALYHVEKGARTFVAFAKAMVEDMGDGIKPYLKSFYMAVKYDPRATVLAADMSPAAEVETADVDAIAADSVPPTAVADTPAQADTSERGSDARQLDQPSPPALEGAPAAPVQDAGGERPARTGADAGGGSDVEGHAGAARAGAGSRAGVGNGAGAPSVPAGGSGRKRAAAGKRRVSERGGREPDPGLFGDGRLGDAPNGPTVQPAAFDPRDFKITDDFDLGGGGPKAKFNGNVAAIRLLKQLEESGKPATADEQAVLARYVGWGGIAQAFDEKNADWTREHAELKALLTDDEYALARQSTQFAHYTSRPIINGIYSALERMGFTGGRVIEPGVGVGNFIGLMPDRLRPGVRFTGVEREAIAHGIASRLYPAQNIQRADFTEFGKGNDGLFDAAIGNPPFSRTVLNDQSGRKHLTGLSVHNYFFAKTVDMLRPGGILAQVVTSSFLDAKKDTARRYIADRTRFLGAIRLPNNAFAKNAGTEVTTDIVFLQKLPESEWASRANKDNRDGWLDVALVPDSLDKMRDLPVNQWFADHPDMMLGDFGSHGTMYGPQQPALIARPGQDTPALLAAAIAKLPANVYTAPAAAGTAAIDGRTIEALKDKTVQEGGHYVEGDKLYRRIEDEAGVGRAVEITPETQWTEKTKLGEGGFAKIVALSQMRKVLRGLLAAEMRDDAFLMKNLRTELNRSYDAYVATHGFINDRGSARVFEDDPDFPLLASLEHQYTPGITAAAARKLGLKPIKATAKKAPIFEKRVLEQRVAPTRADSPADALNISIAERGKIDVGYIGQLLGQDGEHALEALTTGAKPLLFKDPALGEHVLRDAYLSGNVRVKLAQAREAGMFQNVKALEAVQPEDVGAHEISVRAGAPWVPAKVYEDFAAHLLGDGTTAGLTFIPVNGSFVGAIKPGNEVSNINTWGTPRMPAVELLFRVLNNREIKVIDRDSDGTSHVNVPETENANQKASEIRTAFQDWVFKDSDRSELLVRSYNDTNNNYVTRAFDGSYLSFPGKVPDEVIKFRRHQRNAIARIVQDRTSLLDHVVGAGKTFTIVSAAMELKRTGLARKSMVMVPNHLVKQWAADFYRLYPGANVLTATKKDFEKANRRRFLAKIATGEWDAVVMAHSSFGFIRPDPAFEEDFNNEQILNVVATIEAVQNSDTDGPAKKRTVKQLEGLRDRLKERIKNLRDKPMDALLDFKEIGVDQLFVDEAHLFKNLMFTTKMQNVRGLGDPSGSQRAYDLYVKSAQLYQQNGRGQGVVFATGTPVSNSLAEMYHMMRYLMPGVMADQFPSFDAWANTFAAVEPVWMQKVSGDGFKASNRMSTFVNTPELLKLFDQVSDTVTMEDIKAAYRDENDGKEFPLPKLKGDRRTPVSLKKSAAQEAYMLKLAARAKAIEGQRTNFKGSDNALKIMGDGRKAAMDIRLVDLDVTERESGGRVDRATDEVIARWKQYEHVKGTQLVFSDLGTPLAHAKAEMKEWEALNDRVQKGAGEEVQTRANLGDAAALEAIEDAEHAQAELDAKGSDWLDAVKAALRGFSVYDDFRAALVEKGMPAEQIAFIHDYNTDDRKADLFRKVNNGTIRVLLGSTAKLGAGTNVQERLVAEHHLDVPWKPSDVEQREGRIIRQGNLLSDGPQALPGFEVEILAYVTQDTLDMRMWQVQETKLKMINQLRARKIGREIDNAFEDMELSAGEMQAAATGNMDLLNEIKLRTDVRKLEQAARSYDAQRSDLENRRKRAARDVAEIPAQLEKARRGAALSDEYAGMVAAERAKFSMTIDGTVYTDATAAADVLRAMIDATEKDEAGKEKPKPISVNIDGKQYTARAAVGEAFAAVRGDNAETTAPYLTIDGTVYNRTSAAAKVLMPRVADALAEQKEVELGQLGPFRVTGEGAKNSLGSWLELTIEAPGGIERSAQIVLKSAGEDGVRRVTEQAVSAAVNLARAGKSEADYLAHALERAQKTAADIEKTPPMGNWPHQPKLDAARASHKEILDRLRAVPTAAPAVAAADDEAAFARPGDTIFPPLTGDIPQERALAQHQRDIAIHAARMSTSWAGAPAVIVLRNMDDPAVPAAVRALDKQQLAGGAEQLAGGFFHQGKVYLLSDNLIDKEVAGRVLLHEVLGHYGLQGAYGRELGTILDRIAILNPGKVRQAARAHGLDFDKRSERRQAAEEYLAVMAETNPQLGWVRRAIAAIRSWMREHMPGYKSMHLSDDEIIRNYLEPARRFVTSTNAPMIGPRVVPAFSRMEDETPMFSRSLSGVLNDVGDVRLPAGYIVSDLFNASGKLSWWHKTIGTQFNLAQRSPAFKRVYDSVQRFLNDTSRFAGEQADLAPHILPKLDKWRDIGKSPLSAEDTKAIAAPIFEGTLSWVRDETGKAVPLSEREAAAEKLSIDEKARILFKAGKVSEAELKRWQATPLDIYDGAVTNRYQREYLRGGVVWSDDELRSIFKATPKQIALYREFRAATDRSISDLALSEVLRLGGKDVPAGLRAQILATHDHDAAAMRVRDYLWDLAGTQPARARVLNDAADKIVRVADQANDLQARGYAPLSRFGQYSLDVVTPDGDRAYFGLFETSRERARMSRQMRANYPDATITEGTVSQEAHKIFAGVSPETIELFGELLGLDATGDDAKDRAFQQAIKLTTSTRSSMRRLLHRKGIAGFSEDAGRVLAGFVVSNARRSSSNLHMGEVDAAVTDIGKTNGQLQDAAVRLTEYIKNPNEEAATIRGLLFTQYLGGSIASAMVNATQPFTVTLPWLSQFGGITVAGRQMAKASRDAAAFAKTQTMDDKALERALKDSPSVHPQEIHQLMGQASGRGHLVSGDGTRAGDAAAKVRNAFSKITLAWGKVFSVAEQFNRRTTFIAAYRTAQERGLGDPVAFAERAIAETQFTYNKGNKPQWARGALGATLMTFKQYSVNYLELLGRMWQSGPEGKRAALYALAILFLVAGADGLPFADDADDVIDGFMQHLGYNFSTKRAKREFFAGILGDDFGRFVNKGISGLPGVPLDVSGRMGLGNLLPATGLATKKADHTSDVAELLGPVGDFGKRAGQAVGKVLDADLAGAATVIQAQAVRNIVQGIDMLKRGEYRDQKGRKVVDTTVAEAFLKMAGFQPNAVARIQEASGEVMQMVGLTKLVQSELADRMAKAMLDGDSDAMAEVRALRDRWNENNGDMRVTINMPGVLKRLRAMRESKAERLEQTAPKAMRERVRRELAQANQ